MRAWLQDREEKRGISAGAVLAALLALVAVGLAYAVQVAAGTDVDISSIAAPAPQPQANAGPAAVVVPQASNRTAADLPETTTRPLFFADRRPPQATEAKSAASVVPSEPPPAPLKLVGIARIGGQGMILVRGEKEPGRWLGIGEEYRGWQLREVAKETARVEARGRMAELQLYPPKSQRRVSEQMDD